MILGEIERHDDRVSEPHTRHRVGDHDALEVRLNTDGDLTAIGVESARLAGFGKPPEQGLGPDNQVDRSTRTKEDRRTQCLSSAIARCHGNAVESQILQRVIDLHPLARPRIRESPEQLGKERLPIGPKQSILLETSENRGDIPC